MIRKLGNCLLIVMLVGLCGLTQAATVKGLYSADMLVPEQLTQPSNEQLQQGLKAVLIKVSGRSAVVNRPAVRQALQQPSAWLNQFAYQATQTPISAGDGREVLGQQLVLDYDRVLIDQLLQQADMPSIGHARPVLLVWLAQQRSQTARDYVAPESDIYTELADQARARGIPVDIPLFDLNDQTALDVSDLWGFFRQPIEQASARYQPDAILVGRLIQSAGGGWQTEWLLLHAATRHSMKPTGSLTEQLQQVVNESADTVLASLGQRFNYVETGLQLEVANIANIADYLQLQDYLQQLPPVEAVRMTGVEADRVYFRVETQGGVASLDQAIRLDPRLAPMSRLQREDDTTVHSYRWQQ
ncbi:DUF2066 domain-containing protein [Amphritea sp. 1_MG-2023]|uniref:DUF2066 domain-containing protein n=1 Tax=Amphritea sp. 1_MG-2023 TaxID=3062670 RepID=UPI0026E1517F|nr:DUF2066 domain-containing protein [Amphritea sp. 1_MG-2023]MDO6562269.1 DUF2066 domain-containing protein [Amphritea sp. 1_MG-2023]